ncbi:MAG: IclR family transcriptional regulator [Paracoccaceae bacterium]
MTEAKNRLQKYSAPALEKGLDILELLSLQAREGMSQTEIADGIGRSKNEIFRMMVVLEERGYIHRSSDDVFRLTTKFESLFANRNDAARLIEIARPFMAQLSTQTSLSNHFWVLNDDRMQVALRSNVPAAYSLSLSEGTQRGLFGSSVGACFLSGLADQLSRAEALKNAGEFVSDDAFREFDAHVEACRRESVSVMPNPEANGILELSTPIRGQSAMGVVGVLSIPMITAEGLENEIARIVDHLKATADLIADRMMFLSVFQVAE